jgi:hypothetical protein
MRRTSTREATPMPRRKSGTDVVPPVIRFRMIEMTSGRKKYRTLVR